MIKHRRKTKFGRVKKQREALLAGLAETLILRGKIKTTFAKAKALKSHVEKIISRAKVGSLANTRFLGRKLGAETLKKVAKELGPKYASRTGGYVRIFRLPARYSDGAEMAIIEFIQ